VSGIPTTRTSWRTFAAALFVSLGVHGLLALAALSAPPRRPPPPNEPVDLEVVEVEREPEPQPEPEPEPEPPPPPPAPPPPRPAPLRVAKTPPPPQNEAPPPPPNEQPPEQPEGKPPPIRIGVSLSSTTEAGDMAVATGNTLYGKTDEVAGDPEKAKPYAAPVVEKAPFVPESRLSRLPMPRGGSCRASPNDYTPIARDEGIEGVVVLRVFIDETGKVGEVHVVQPLGYGLDEVAVRRMKACRFNPGLGPDGKPVGTEIRYKFRFQLDVW